MFIALLVDLNRLDTNNMAKKKAARIPPKLHLELLSEVQVDRWGHTVFENDDIQVVVSAEIDYGGCFYESDSPSIEMKVTTYKKVWK
jgi:hypothetical protein